jgi:hypothetical protein
MRGCQFLAVSDGKPPGNDHCREQPAVVFNSWYMRTHGCKGALQGCDALLVYMLIPAQAGLRVLREPANAVKLLQTR